MKNGIPLILLRNLSPKEGLMNGTRLKLIESLNHLLHCQILTGPCIGKFVFIPRINFTLSKSQLPFTLCRRQFPVQVAFAIRDPKIDQRMHDTESFHVGQQRISNT